jgi:predicted nucleic acid-binding Zn ribbon protein
VIQVHRVIPEALAGILRKAPLSDGKIAFAWRSAVGPAMDRGTSVTLRDRVLHVMVKDAAWGREVQRSEALIHARLEGLLGPDVVRGLRIENR